MSKEMSFWVQPRCLLLLAAFTIFLVLALSHTRKVRVGHFPPPPTQFLVIITLFMWISFEGSLIFDKSNNVYVLGSIINR